MKIEGFISLGFIIILLGHLLLKPNVGGTILYLVLPLPLNMVIFLKAFRDWLDSKNA